MLREINQTERNRCHMHGSRWQGREEHAYKNMTFRIRYKVGGKRESHGGKWESSVGFQGWMKPSQQFFPTQRLGRLAGMGN